MHFENVRYINSRLSPSQARDPGDGYPLIFGPRTLVLGCPSPASRLPVIEMSAWILAAVSAYLYLARSSFSYTPLPLCFVHKIRAVP